MGGFFGRVRGVKEASAAFDAYITETVAAGAPEREARVAYLQPGAGTTVERQVEGEFGLWGPEPCT